MKIIPIILATFVLCACVTVSNDVHARYRTHQIIDVEPRIVIQYYYVNTEVCHNSNRRYHGRGYRHRNHYQRGRGDSSDAIVGAIVGGLVGRNFGGGSGRDTSTIIGAAIGAGVASDNRRNYHPRNHRSGVQYCEIVRERRTRRVPDGYIVHYIDSNTGYRRHTYRDYYPRGDMIHI